MKHLNYALAIFLVATPAFGALTPASCKTKVKTAMQAATGRPIQEGTFNVLLAFCEGLIEEIQQNAVVLPDQLKANVGGTLYPVVNTGKVQ